MEMVAFRYSMGINGKSYAMLCYVTQGKKAYANTDA